MLACEWSTSTIPQPLTVRYTFYAPSYLSSVIHKQPRLWNGQHRPLLPSASPPDISTETALQTYNYLWYADRGASFN